MATDDASDSDRIGRTVKGFASTAARLVADLFIATCWVLLLTLLFLENGWPEWAFYALLIVGIGVYVAITAAWRADDPSA
ncbi:hypothetical protein [Natronorubrum halophilum]|uniref:hypothetical protein n=1 Tax=Natronorubrum halophilum TaxID=1702106 RepID=UPI000EF66B0C|nr:hypothetical protein [Natronorubrum halophilum]